MARVPAETRYAIAVRDGADLRLFMWVKRAAAGDVFVFWKTTEDKWTPHASHHVDGTKHFKSHGSGRILPRSGQPLTAGFTGAEQLLTTQISLDVVRRLNRTCVVADYGSVVEFAAAEIDMHASTGRTSVTVDLVAPGADPVIFPATAQLQRMMFVDAIPYISVTLWDQTAMFTPC